jgi:large subunit ribosomal protein L6
MSKIGKMPIKIPENVKVNKDRDIVRISGPKGELSVPLPVHLRIEINDKEIRVSNKGDGKYWMAQWGTFRANLANAVRGVSSGFEKKLEIVGVGYQAQMNGNKLVLKIGFSHLVEYEVPDRIKIDIEKNKFVTVSGIDRQLVGDVAQKIRCFRPPEPYKGTGIKYVGEEIRRKAGKAAVVSGAASGGK